MDQIIYGEQDLGVITLKPSKLFAIDIETFGHNRLPGDCATSPLHGIIGVSICNSQNEAQYFAISEGSTAVGCEITSFIEYLNDNWFKPGSTVLLHNCAFDLKFLIARGLKLNGVRIVDTWIKSSIQSEGVFKSNKLKDLVREQFGEKTEEKTVIDKWLEEHKTRDFGEIPIETLAPYAIQDVKYTLMLFTHGKPFTTDELKSHDLYVRNTLHLIDAELRGVCINRELLSSSRVAMKTLKAELQAGLQKSLGSASVDLNDLQAIMRHLHSKNLYPAPREMFGQPVFCWEPEFLKECGHNVTYVFSKYYPVVKTLAAFDPEALKSRLTVGDDIILHPSFQPSIFSRGGVVAIKTPEVTELLDIGSDVRPYFRPRANYKFISLDMNRLAVKIIAYYAGDQEVLHASGNLYALLTRYVTMSVAKCELLVRQTFEGSGRAVLERRLKLIKEKADGPALQMKLGEALQELKQRVAAGKRVRDLMGRGFIIPQDKAWRAFAMLVQSGFGGILSQYLDVLCRALEPMGARLVLVSGKEFLFEVPEETVLRAADKICALESVPFVPFPIDADKRISDVWQGTPMWTPIPNRGT